jgi:hypothetical protein
MKQWIDKLTKHLKYLVVGAGLKERCSDYLPVAVLILNATKLQFCCCVTVVRRQSVRGWQAACQVLVLAVWRSCLLKPRVACRGVANASGACGHDQHHISPPALRKVCSVEHWQRIH